MSNIINLARRIDPQYRPIIKFALVIIVIYLFVKLNIAIKEEFSEYKKEIEIPCDTTKLF